MDVLEPWLSVARQVPAWTAAPRAARAAGVVPPAADSDDEQEGLGGELTAEERTTCRTWAQKNERRLNLPATGDQGRLRQAVVDAWIDAGKPAATAKRPPRKTVAARRAG